MRIESFRHAHAGHCESGVMAALLTHYGQPISESMAFGLSSSLVFFHMSLIKVGGMPLTAYRMLPGHVLSGLEKNLGIEVARQRFKNAPAGMRALDARLAAGQPVGLQTSVYWLTYFPPDMRFHFNGHNLIVYGKEGDDYLISDPVFEHPQVCAGHDLQKARFTKGAFAPRGLLYYPRRVNPEVNYERAVRRAIDKTVKVMLRGLPPVVGMRAIRRVAGGIRRLSEHDGRYSRLFIGNIIRMQEEIGTGGGGFRFMYAAFLQEAGRLLASDRLLEAARLMTEAGDQWRAFALRGARLCKDSHDSDFSGLADELLLCADREERVYRLLRRF